MNHRTA